MVHNSTVSSHLISFPFSFLTNPTRFSGDLEILILFRVQFLLILHFVINFDYSSSSESCRQSSLMTLVKVSVQFLLDLGIALKRQASAVKTACVL